MKLYCTPPSPNSRKVLAVIRHLALDVEIEPVDLTQGEQMTPAYLAINPNHLTPALVDGDFKLWESNAIIQYLASLGPENSLWPLAPETRADISRWQCWLLAHLGPALDVFAFERLVKPLFGIGEPDETAVERISDTFHRFATILDTHLAERDWLVGDRLTLADFSLGAPFALKEIARIPVDDYAAINRWYARIEALDAWQQTHVAPPPRTQAA
ncbi:MAG: glutathione S-transferase family protein [Gammaproteobacteria bacterium]